MKVEIKKKLKVKLKEKNLEHFKSAVAKFSNAFEGGFFNSVSLSNEELIVLKNIHHEIEKLKDL